MYRDTPAGANYTGDILQAPMGIGQRMAVYNSNIINY